MSNPTVSRFEGDRNDVKNKRNALKKLITAFVYMFGFHETKRSFFVKKFRNPGYCTIYCNSKVSIDKLRKYV